MTSPSYEDRICAMFDSFYKKSSHNFIRNLNQGETSRDKHYIGETVEYDMNLLPHWFCFAYVPGWYGRLEELAELARLEPWRFRESVYSTKNLDTPIFREIHTCNLKKQAIDYNEEKESEKSAQYFHVESEYACFHTRLYLNACLLAKPVIPWLAVIVI